MRAPILSLVVLASALASGTLFAGANTATVKGKVGSWDKLLPRVYIEAAKPEAHRYTWREPSATVKADFRKLTADVTRDVCIAALGTGQAKQHEPLKVIVSGGRISPTTLVLSPGSRLSFKNADPFPHELYEVNDPAWAANSTAPGSSREWAAGKPGVHVIRDMLFPSVVMNVVVEANAVELAFPDREGSFSMALPPGDYTLRAYFDGKAVGKAADGVHVADRDVELKEPLPLGSSP